MSSRAIEGVGPRRRVLDARTARALRILVLLDKRDEIDEEIRSLQQELKDHQTEGLLDRGQGSGR